MWIAGATVVVITTTVMSCGDTPTMPLGSPLHLPRFDVAPLSDSVLGPYTLSGASNYQTSLVLPPKFAYSTLVQVEAAGIVTQTSSTGGQVAIGPEGWGVGSNCYKASAVHFGSVRTNWSCQIDAAPETPDPVTLAMIVKDSGTAYIGNGNFYLCPDCWYSYSGSREFTIRVARPGLKLAANDTFVVPSVSKSIAFTAAVDPNAVWGKTVPRTVLRWRWAPDGGTETTITNCGMTCSRSLNQPGTMYVDVRVNGRELTAGVRIHAEELKLVGVPDTVFPGEGITYTASTKFGSSITNGAWQWRRGATMIGDTLTAAQCQAGSTTCHVETFEFGEMEFTGMVAGVQMSATDSSFVWPCPPTDSINPDSILMDPAVLKRLFEALKTGNADSTPASLKKKEQRLVIIRRTDGTRTVRNVTDTSMSNQCSNTPLSPFPPNVSPDIMVGEAHAHVSSKQDTVYGCFGGQAVPGGPGGIAVKSDYGGSRLDSAYILGKPYSSYVVEKDSGYVFRLDPGGSPTGNTNPNRYRRTRGVCVVKG